ncbi:hypothetical protein M3E18_01195 [Kocuria sp. p3-SID1433]|uniref:hypothetical protein n=1 Tax=unclassified Kocuria TaxID=2649579 RepID=UPI0021A2844D|nr:MULTISPECIES: hypothetical protein [unclassified Kocuria]MCT1600866.1 hypothetical protein [Kocuria sp. p3-SID1428]MCT2179173.1 hypothetical protein [Kocuria sp. p3-SID1433]
MTEKNRIQSVMPASLPAEPAERTVYSYGVRAVVEEAGVAALARPQFLVEISAIAHLG